MPRAMMLSDSRKNHYYYPRIAGVAAPFRHHDHPRHPRQEEEALTMSDRVAVMSAGTVVQVGRPTEVYERPRNRFVSEFLGTANIFDATVQGPHRSRRMARRPRPAIRGPRQLSRVTSHPADR